MFRRLAIMVFVTTVAAGCTAGAATSPSVVSSSSSSSAPATGGGTIEGVAWVMDADSLTLATPVPGIDADIRFEAGEVSGSNGCNRYGGSYRVDGDRLTISKLTSTQIACRPPADALETAFMDALSRVSSFGAADGALTLADGDGASLLRFHEVETTPLTGQYWAMTGMAGDDGLLTPLPSTEYAIQFGDDGAVDGTTGCNTFRASARIVGASMSIRDLAATEKSCDDSADQVAQEAAFLALLPRVASFVIRENQLELHAKDGSLLMALRPDDSPGSVETE